MSRNEKLFRAIVVMGAAMTTPACDDDRCLECVPTEDAARPDTVATADAQVSDAGVDSPPAPTDAPVDVVLIL